MSSHLDASGRAVMIDVTDKAETARTASAEGVLSASEAVVRAIRENTLHKGDALAVARVAGIMAAKNTSRAVPLCHDIPLGSCDIEFELGRETIRVVCRVVCRARTGAEMEALHGVAVALLALYDMAKSVDKGMEITRVRLLTKTGGKSGDFSRPDAPGGG